ncbi:MULTISPECIES: hypothetical protein [Rhodopseudomonas]|uniref:hypothetical protein n=1 Tax=Rhodopseudomonas TaxID=1073 RepID=UPI0006968A34|nr:MULTISPECIES: hypothetical protein [Rhodopseudomonas]MDF3808840.1 hypothetical protein [Rhodopseudomonas sp. BAL398]WOK19860.1 hypothetical protein RBJ75_10215 [Rhodopseudomonas sp. BAL398]
MLAHPELGFVDGDVDFLRAELYAACRSRFGIASALPAQAYVSPVFQELENEKVWTRDWVCIGSDAEIRAPGDLMSYTVGNHAIHVQRLPGGGLVARFNKAQHGGCRAVPAQCQTGRKTKCSYTSCGHSRDRDVIPGDRLGSEMTPEAGQYLGVYPERLLSVSVETRGPFIYVNVDPTLGRDVSLPAIEAVVEGNATRVRGQWLEARANWKLAGAALVDTARSLPDGGGASNYISAEWYFPNLVVIKSCRATLAIVLQPTAFDQTLWRMSVFKHDQFPDTAGDELIALVERAAEVAAAAQAEVERPQAGDDIEHSRAGWKFNQQFLDRICAEHVAYWNAPLLQARVGR